MNSGQALMVNVYYVNKLYFSKLRFNIEIKFLRKSNPQQYWEAENNLLYTFSEDPTEEAIKLHKKVCVQRIHHTCLNISERHICFNMILINSQVLN